MNSSVHFGQKAYNEQSSVRESYSPENLKNRSSFGYKRASINIDLDQKVNEIKLSAGYGNNNYDLRNRQDSKPLDSIQNREQDINS